MKEILWEGKEIQTICIQKANSRNYIVEITGFSTGDPVPTKCNNHYKDFPNYHVIKVLTITQSHIRSLFSQMLHISYTAKQCSSIGNVGTEIATFIKTLPYKNLYY